MGDPDAVEAAKLVGKWFGRVSGEPVGLEFLPDGRLAYVVVSGDRAQTIRMTYRIEADHIITDQPGAPREERTRFWFEDIDHLVLAFGGIATKFERE